MSSLARFQGIAILEPRARRVLEDYRHAVEPRRRASDAESNGDYYADRRLQWLRSRLGEMGVRPTSLLDVGCGQRCAPRQYFDALGVRSVVHWDVSHGMLSGSLDSAAGDGSSKGRGDDFIPADAIDLAFSNEVFHRLPLEARRATVIYVHQALKRGGLFSYWERNPLSPAIRNGARRSTVNSERGPLRASDSHRLLRGAGFDIVRTDFVFVFPPSLQWLQPIEPYVSSLPFGMQYQVLCRKP